MTLLEFLDRWSERHANKPRDTKAFIGFAFLAGYYLLVYRFVVGEVPAKNVDLIRDAMLTLGPPVGLIVGAMFNRSDNQAAQATLNTARALDTIKAVAENTPAKPPAEPEGQG